MVAVTPAPPALSGELELFHTTDPLLYNSPVLVFYGAASSLVSTSSRIQIHVLTPAGLESYARLAISPSSPYYAAVNALPREEQGDEVIRGIAYGLSKYFTEIPNAVKDCWTAQACGSKKPSSSGIFGPAHIAILASRMTKVEDSESLVEDIQRSFGEQSVSWMDVDVVLPQGSIQDVGAAKDGSDLEDASEEELCKRKYGRYASLIGALGEPAFLPTSKLKRAPSKPTSLGRSQMFRQSQKEIVRKEMCELVDTEESYVQKLSQLIHGTANGLRDQVCQSAIPVASPAERAVLELFPDTLDRIAQVNATFLDAIRKILDDTEEAAIADLQVDTDNASTTQEDAVGVIRFAKCLVDYLPKFSQDYPEYMGNHARVPTLLKQIMSSSDTLLSSKVQEVGEQRLMSMLIEPIQRLPRYTLYIDTISKQLPVGHPALKALLKARDIVSDICSQDASELQDTDIEANLQTIVHDWPSEQMNLGRLVTILDASELEAPFEPLRNRVIPGMLLLFTRSIIFLEKSNSNSTSARSLLAELERPAAMASSRPRTPSSLHFVDAISTDAAVVTEMLDGQAICVLQPEEQGSCRSSTFLLEGAYTYKAARLCEELTKARVESRFAESERMSGKWDVRSATAGPGDINLFAAIFEDSEMSREQYGQICVVMEPDKNISKRRVGKNGLKTLATIRRLSDCSYQITIESVFAASTRDKVDEPEVLSILLRRLTALLHMQCSIRNPAITAGLVTRNHTLLKSLHLLAGQAELTTKLAGPQDQDRVNRPISPVKMLSSFLSSNAPGTPHPMQRRMPPPASILKDAPSMAPPTPRIPRPASKENSRPASHDQVTPKSNHNTETTGSTNPSKKLEDTLSTYLLALQARKGNIVGRVIKARISADELVVNELYNSLLEDPNMMVLAAESSVDILFSAFEKFLNNAWREELGPVLPRSTLNAILDKAESSLPTDFQTSFKTTFRGLSSHNQRALRGIVKLLAELLDGTGNDGDRGILTAAFAELLVPGEDPYTFVSLIDRFVEDIEALFGETVHVREISAMTNPGHGHERSRSVNTGSLTSNTSSLRKKFGFGGLSRENSKSEQESKVGSVWRTLSKNRPPTEQPSSISRATMHRTRSTDIDTRTQQQRPLSQDKPAVLGSFPFERPASQDSSTFMQSPNGLGTIGENPNTPAGPGRKKRRSSLSDLHALQSTSSTPIQSPPGAKNLASFYSSRREPQQPSIESPSKASSLQSPNRQPETPTRNLPRSRLPSSFRKENSPSAAKAYETSLPRPRSASKQPDEVIITSHASVRRNEAGSGIPSASPRHERTPSATPARTGLSERPTSGNAMKVKPTGSPEKTDKVPPSTVTITPTPTKKLRMQSPQKLRERLQLEQRAITTSQSSLADELSKIGDDLSALGPGRIGSVRSKISPYNHTRTASVPDTHAVELQKRLKELETLMQTTLDDLTQRTSSIQADLASSLSVSETKARKLDELYREANAENEALYARFNEELGKVLKAVRSGEGVEELRKKVREGSEESGRLRRENARLKREVIGLRSQLKE